jgi:hypothetical protein
MLGLASDVSNVCGRLSAAAMRPSPIADGVKRCRHAMRRSNASMQCISTESRRAGRLEVNARVGGVRTNIDVVRRISGRIVDGAGLGISAEVRTAGIRRCGRRRVGANVQIRIAGTA